MPTRTAEAVWSGSITEGKGTIKSQSGVLNQPYDWKSRSADGPLTNPEELLGAAHAGCFSMALSLMLGEAGLTADKIETHADVTLEKMPDGFAITAVHLNVVASIPGADQAKFQEIANKAKLGCPVSKLFKADISMDAKLA